MKQTFLLSLILATILSCSKETLLFTESANAEGEILNRSLKNIDTLNLDINKDGANDIKINFKYYNDGTLQSTYTWISLNDLKCDLVSKIYISQFYDTMVILKSGMTVGPTSDWISNQDPVYAKQYNHGTFGSLTKYPNKGAEASNGGFNKGDIFAGVRYRVDSKSNNWYYGWILLNMTENETKIIRYSFNKNMNEPIMVGDV